MERWLWEEGRRALPFGGYSFIFAGRRILEVAGGRLPDPVHGLDATELSTSEQLRW